MGHGCGRPPVSEAAQVSGAYVLQLDWVTSVDDVLLNAAGAGLAALASRRWWRTAGSAPERPAPIAPVAGR